MTIVQRIKLLLGVTYQCRCGALVSKDRRNLHEEFHVVMRDFIKSPTAEEMAAASCLDGQG